MMKTLEVAMKRRARNAVEARMTRLKFLRMHADRTAFDVCQEVGMSAARYSYLERGLIAPKPEERAALARVFGVAEETLFRPVTVRRRTPSIVN
jgi:transcriptional regulator with XRE-family HTH domain